MGLLFPPKGRQAAVFSARDTGGSWGEKPAATGSNIQLVFPINCLNFLALNAKKNEALLPSAVTFWELHRLKYIHGTLMQVMVY